MSERRYLDNIKPFFLALYTGGGGGGVGGGVSKEIGGSVLLAV